MSTKLRQNGTQCPRLYVCHLRICFGLSFEININYFSCQQKTVPAWNRAEQYLVDNNKYPNCNSFFSYAIKYSRSCLNLPPSTTNAYVCIIACMFTTYFFVAFFVCVSTHIYTHTNSIISFTRYFYVSTSLHPSPGRRRRRRSRPVLTVKNIPAHVPCVRPSFRVRRTTAIRPTRFTTFRMIDTLFFNSIRTTCAKLQN